MIALWLGLALAQERVERVVLTGTEPAYGNPDSQWTIVQFSDWQCPHCARAFERLEQASAADPAIRVVFKVYPLSGACNTALSSATSSARCHLADAAACAHVQGGWPVFATWAFGNMSALASATPADLVAGASALGLDGNRLDRCLHDGEGRGLVTVDAAEGARLALVGTPTLFVRDPARGDWIRADGGPDGALTLLRALRDGTVEHP